MRRFLALLLAALAAPAALPARAADWAPERTITLVNPYAPGGASDAFLRIFGDFMTRQLGQSTVVVNRDGGSGTVGMRYVAGSPPDGHVLGFTPVTAIAVQPYMVRNLGISPDSFAPVCGMVENYLGLFVRADSPYRDARDLVAAARRRTLTYGSPGPNSLPSLAVVGLARAANVEFEHIPYRGDPPALNEVMGGRLDFAATVISSASELVAGGQLRLITTVSPRRHPGFPDVPILPEQGFEVVQPSPVGLYAPRGTPEAVLARLEAVCRAALDDPGVQRIAAQGKMVLQPMSRGDFAALVASEYRRYGPLLKSLGVQPE
jgi:tripartite-type tricarboxylate transporter receptor subunit TctC